jgi:DNA-binding NtrC family response regulator
VSDQKLSTKELILVVDDEPMVLRVCRRILEREGYEVLLANDCEQAFAYLGEPEGGEVSLLVCDIRMPEMQGDELAGELLELQPDLEVIFISGHAKEDAVDGFRKKARAKFLPKPFSADELLEAVATALAS